MRPEERAQGGALPVRLPRGGRAGGRFNSVVECSSMRRHLGDSASDFGFDFALLGPKYFRVERC